MIHTPLTRYVVGKNRRAKKSPSISLAANRDFNDAYTLSVSISLTPRKESISGFFKGFPFIPQYLVGRNRDANMRWSEHRELGVSSGKNGVVSISWGGRPFFLPVYYCIF